MKKKKALKELARLKYPDDTISYDRIFSEMKRPRDFKMDEFFKNRYERINLDDVNNLIDLINSEITEKDNIVDLGDNKEIYFRDLTELLYDIKDGKISNFNKEREYEKVLKILKKSSRIEQNLVDIQDFMNNILIF